MTGKAHGECRAQNKRVFILARDKFADHQRIQPQMPEHGEKIGQGEDICIGAELFRTQHLGDDGQNNQGSHGTDHAPAHQPDRIRQVLARGAGLFRLGHRATVRLQAVRAPSRFPAPAKSNPAPAGSPGNRAPSWPDGACGHGHGVFRTGTVAPPSIARGFFLLDEQSTRRYLRRRAKRIRIEDSQQKGSSICSFSSSPL